MNFILYKNKKKNLPVTKVASAVFCMGAPLGIWPNKVVPFGAAKLKPPVPHIRPNHNLVFFLLLFEYLKNKTNKKIFKQKKINFLP